MNTKPKKIEVIISAYMRALNKEKLSPKTWDKIARLHKILLETYGDI